MRRFDLQLEDLQARLLEMGRLVEAAIQNSVGALAGRDEAQARQVLDNEPSIDALEMEIDDLAVILTARQQPTARDMRFMAAAIKINNDLERMGDLSAEIAERALVLMEQPPLALANIPHLAELASAMVRDSLDALVQHDAEKAKRVLLSDDAVDRLRDELYGILIGGMTADGSMVSGAVQLLFVVRNIERIADHATNIAEDVLYYLRGVDVRHHACDLTA